MLPKGAVIDAAERQQTWGRVPASGAEYTGPAITEHPVLPFLVFGATYDLDIVLVSKHPEWDMHEYARLQTPEGPLWLAKDTRESTGDQLLVADIDDIHAWMPEIPLARKSSPVHVTNRSEGDTLDLEFRYENFDGEQVTASFIGPRPGPGSRQTKRNGSTMGHSRDQVMAVLDLSHRTFGSDASMTIGGESVGIERALWVKPLRLGLRQTQGGIAEARFDLFDAPDASGFSTRHHMPGGEEVVRDWEIDDEGDYLVVRQRSDLRTLGYRFRVTDAGSYELTDAWVRAWNAEVDTFHIRFSPALPDLRRPIRERHRSRWVMDVHGQRNHAVGTLVTRWTDDGTAELKIRADKPWWVADRCVTTTVEPADRPSSADAVPQTEVETDVRPCK